MVDYLKLQGRGDKIMLSELIITDLLSGRGPVGSLAVLWLCLTRTQIHHMKITPTATSSTTDRLTAIATVCPVVGRGLLSLDLTPTGIE